MAHEDDPEADRARPTFSPAADHFLRGALALGGATLLISVCAAFSWYQFGIQPDQQGEVSQPILFSHRHHVEELNIDCRFCHSSVEKGAAAGIPSTSTCLTCHAYLFADSPMLEPLRDAAADGTPVEWQRVHDLKDVVYFNHSIHVQRGVSCLECHGQVNDMPAVQQVEPLTMGWCLECHRNPEGRLISPQDVFASAIAGEKPPGEPFRHPRLQTRNLNDCTTCHR